MASGTRPATVVLLGIGSVAAATLVVWLATCGGSADDSHKLPPPAPSAIIPARIDPPVRPLPPAPADDQTAARRQAIDQARSAGVLGSLALGGTVTLGPPPGAPVTGYKDTVRREIRRHVPRVKLCYERRLLAVPDLSGTVRTSFTIELDGTVTDVTAMGLDDEVADCIAGVLHTLTFSAPDGGGKVHINYPFVFHTAP